MTYLSAVVLVCDQSVRELLGHGADAAGWRHGSGVCQGVGIWLYLQRLRGGYAYSRRRGLVARLFVWEWRLV
jgi:hypothetical protein